MIDSIDPPCGPTYGYTQITVNGKNFMDMGFGKVKCIFNDTHYMNATIVDESTIKCSTPKLSDEQAGLPPQHMYYRVDLTLNGRENADGEGKFSYYPDPVIKATTNSAWGPVSGGTTSELAGIGFTHPNVCKLRVRYGALETTPTLVTNDTHI